MPPEDRIIIDEEDYHPDPEVFTTLTRVDWLRELTQADLELQSPQRRRTLRRLPNGDVIYDPENGGALVTPAKVTLNHQNQNEKLARELGRRVDELRIVTTEGITMYDRMELLKAIRREHNKCSWSSDPTRFKRMATILALIYSSILRNKNGDMLSLSRDFAGKVSYARCEADQFDLKKRVKTTLMRYFRRQLKVTQDNLPDHLLTEVCFNIMSNFADVESKITIVTGEELKKAYKDRFGGETCMTGGSRSNLLNIYSDNPDKIALIKYEDQKTSARALLWTAENGDRIVDRIYPDNRGTHIVAIKHWAREKGFVTRTNNAMDSQSLSNDGTYEFHFKYDGRFPYIDTFNYGEVDGLKVILSNDCEKFEDRFTETNGEYSNGENGYYCEGCGDRIYEDDLRHVGDEIYCTCCYEDNFSYCDNCSESFPRSDVNYVESRDEFVCDLCMAELELTCCDDCGGYFEETTKHDGEDLCSVCAEEYKRRCS